MTDESSKVVILGAGLIGLKVAEGLSGHVADITIVEMANHLMPSILDEEDAACFRSILKKAVLILFSVILPQK